MIISCAVISFASTSFSHAEVKKTYSTSSMGTLGLNTIPSARMDKVGTARIHLSTVDPYIHASMGFQVTEPLYINVRQTSEISSLNDYADRIYPGVDFKLRLLKESAQRPEIAFGMNAPFGNRRLSSEYFSFSKRYHNFDFTAGVAWGKLGSAGHISNPLKSISSHFGKDRETFSEDTQTANDWFTGNDIGFFGGVEYFTPLKGLSLKAEYGGDDYSIEKATFDYNAPAPWSLGLNYQPFEWVDLSVTAIGKDKLMGRLSLQGGLQDWVGKNREYTEPEKLKIPRPNENTKDFLDTQVINQKLHLVNFTTEDNHAAGQINLSSYAPASLQIGHALRKISNNTKSDIENYTIALKHKGLRGPDLKIIRSDFEKAVLRNSGSAEEVWHDVHLENKNKISLNPFHKLKPLDIRFILDNHLSLTEDDIAQLYRTSAVIETTQELPFGLLSGFSGRVNLKGNIEDLTLLRGLTNFVYNVNNKNVRGNIESFANNRFSIEHSYLSWLKSINTNTHFAITGGILEETFGGIGGELLYRPFGKTFALGAEIWRVFPRNPDSRLALDTFDDPRTTGHVNFFYELPNKNTTFYARLGQYLAEDLGATFGVKTAFKNGTSIDAFLTGSNETDRDIFGGTTNIYSGVRVNIPIGNIPLMPDGSAIRTRIEQIGRDTGQHLEKPVDLYELTEPMSYRQLTQNWTDLAH